MKTIYKVCIPHTNKDYFDYEAIDLNPCIGARVWVPFRKQRKLGIVLNQTHSDETKTPLKAIEALIDEQPLLSDDLLKLCHWISNYYQSPLSEIIPLALPKKYRLGQPSQLPMGDFYQLNMDLMQAKSLISARARKQIELIDFLATQQEAVSKQTLTQNGFSTSQLLALLNAQIIVLSQKVLLPQQAKSLLTPKLQLNEEQTQALKTIKEQLHHYHCFLLNGVTGSGKTEVYLQAIEHTLQQDKQILVLVPEIGLTPQLVSRFTARFQQSISVIHSSLNETERQVAWQLAKEKKIHIVIGTRAAVFTPLPDLGLIIIDEEHDTSLKQAEGVRYSARDTALMRAYFANIPIILGSATPSLESLHNSNKKKYTMLHLTQKALSTTPLHYQVIDLRAQVLQQGLAKPTLQIIAEHLQKNNQVLIFINRRGFAPVLLCHQCGWMADCSACDSHLTMHKQKGQMICHQCGLIQKIPHSCKSCHSPELVPIGAGTQRIHEFLTHYFPEKNILRIDRDAVQQKDALEKQLDKIHNGEAQLIIGTQMLAKGHHFPNLSLVVILDTDAGLYNQDFKALEHLGQLLTQVAGRAGRAKEPGQVVIQTHLPDHPLLNTLIRQGYGDFAKALLTTRQEAELPPFHYLAVIRAQSNAIDKVLSFLHRSKDHIKMAPLTIMGPAPAPLPRKANQYRMQLLIKSPCRTTLNHSLTQLREWLSNNKLNSGVRWNIDIDPMDLS